MITFDNAKNLKVGDTIYTILDKSKKVVEAKIIQCEPTRLIIAGVPTIFIAWKVKNGVTEYSCSISERYGRWDIFLTQEEAVQKLISDYEEKIAFYNDKIDSFKKLLN